MRVSVLALGSRGDVQPYLAFALGLQAAGHQVSIVTLGGFEDLVGRYPIQHTSVLGDPRELSLALAGRGWLKSREGALRYARGFSKVVNAVVGDALAGCWSAAHDAQALIMSPIGALVGYHIAEKLRIPMVLAVCLPVEPTRYDWNGHITARSRLRGLISPVIQGGLRYLGWQALRSSTNRARRDVLSLAPLPLTAPMKLAKLAVPQLCAYSPAVIPRPPDWPALVEVTGYWFLEAAGHWQPGRDLLDFLESGPPPVYVGFGSTGDVRATATLTLVAEALARSGQRGVVQGTLKHARTGSGWQHIRFVDDVPHDWLFPQLSAVVHHGGAGTTAAALRAGVPSVVVPIFADQPFWAARVHALGVSPPPIPRRELSSERLAHAIRGATSDSSMRDRARILGDCIRAENGVARAVEAFDRLIVRRLAHGS